MLASFNFFSGLVTKTGSCTHRKNLKGYWSLVPRVVRVRYGRRVKESYGPRNWEGNTSVQNISSRAIDKGHSWCSSRE